MVLRGGGDGGAGGGGHPPSPPGERHHPSAGRVQLDLLLLFHHFRFSLSLSLGYKVIQLKEVTENKAMRE